MTNLALNERGDAIGYVFPPIARRDVTPTGKPALLALIRGTFIAMVAAWLIMAPAAGARAAVSCVNLETMPAAHLITEVQWKSDYGLVPSRLGCERWFDEKSCEYQNTLVTDRRLGAERRLLVVNADHVSGSGAHDVLTVYACRQGRVAAVLTGAFEYGIRIERADAEVIVFTAGLWEGADPHCCPSHEQRLHYVWSPESMSYQLERRETFQARR
jgi:hypothetical protein